MPEVLTEDNKHVKVLSLKSIIKKDGTQEWAVILSGQVTYLDTDNKKVVVERVQTKLLSELPEDEQLKVRKVILYLKTLF